ncbi:hypothetical protein K0M31_006744 [Melipona bicolor]|uniref:Uncharacterized protein n=1 Tax=Melipona bicolor TaxID=60889 RepID=A0AA40KL29_9HYME|nr:hypothetical protein K0M31_006744 [Melipona bicolor]
MPTSQPSMTPHTLKLRILQQIQYDQMPLSKSKIRNLNSDRLRKQQWRKTVELFARRANTTALLESVIEIADSTSTNEFPRNRNATTVIRLPSRATHRDSGFSFVGLKRKLLQDRGESWPVNKAERGSGLPLASSG